MKCERLSKITFLNVSKHSRSLPINCDDYTFIWKSFFESTFNVISPRIVCLDFGNIRLFLKSRTDRVGEQKGLVAHFGRIIHYITMNSVIELPLTPAKAEPTQVPLPKSNMLLTALKLHVICILVFILFPQNCYRDCHMFVMVLRIIELKGSFTPFESGWIRSI